MSYSGFNMMGVVDDKEMQKSLRELAIFQKKDVNEITQQWAGTLGRYLASWTKPMAGSLKIDKKSEWKAVAGIEKGIRWVYQPKEMFFQRNRNVKLPNQKGREINAVAWIKRLLKKGEQTEASMVARRINEYQNATFSNFDGGKAHKKSRLDKTQERERIIVLDSPNLKKYIAKKRKMAGFTKAAWINAAFQITGKVPPKVGKWVHQHTASPGRGTFSIQGPIGKATLSSRLPWASDTIYEDRAFLEFSASFRQAMDKAIDYHLKKEQRKK